MTWRRTGGAAAIRGRGIAPDRGLARPLVSGLHPILQCLNAFTGDHMVTQTLLSRYHARMPDFHGSSGASTEIPGAGTDAAQSSVAGSSVAGLRQAMAADRITATALSRHYLDRITDVNPALRAVIAVSPDALDEAAASDEETDNEVAEWDA